MCGAGMERWKGGLSGVGILPSSYNKDPLAEGIPVTKILRTRSQTEKRRRQEEGPREKQNKTEGRKQLAGRSGGQRCWRSGARVRLNGCRKYDI